MKITLPKNPITPEEILQRNKKLLSDDKERNGVLAKALVFIKMQEPVANDDLKKLIQDYYKIEFDINLIKRATKRLFELGFLHSITTGELTMMPQNEWTEMHKRAYKKFFIYLEHIPKQFRRNYDKMAYYWISNGTGNAYVEWACKIMGFKFEE